MDGAVLDVSVLGATGRTGRLLTAELLDRGHRVTVLVRDPAKLGDLTGRVRAVVGDSRDPLALTAIVDGADAVLSALGPTSKEPTLHQDTATALVAAMKSANVRRFIGISGAGIDVAGDQKALRDKAISALIARFGGAVVKDKPAEYQVWAASGLDWTLIRPPRLRDGRVTGAVQHDAFRSTSSTSMRRADLAVFLVDVLEQELYLQAAPFAATSLKPLPQRRVS